MALRYTREQRESLRNLRSRLIALQVPERDARMARATAKLELAIARANNRTVLATIATENLTARIQETTRRIQAETEVIERRGQHDGP
jgi:hypothetical protein